MTNSDAGKKKGKNLNYLRAANQAGAIKILSTSGPVSRQALARRLGLTRMSITYIVNQLMEKGIVTQVFNERQRTVPAGENKLNLGRKPILVGICPDSLHAIGTYISRYSVQSAICNLAGDVKAKAKQALPKTTTKKSLLAIITKQIDALLQQHDALHIIGIGIASIGLISTETGTVTITTDFDHIENLSLKAILEERYSLPTFVVNDMKAAALAEHFYGAAKEYTDFVYLGVTNGVGAGVVINGKLFEGSEGFSSEIGHTSIQRQGGKCTCGNTGCAELYVSVPRILQKADCEDWETLLCQAERGDAKACRILNQMCKDLSVLLVNIANAFDPQAIVIGHEGAQLGRKYFDKLQKNLDERTITRNLKHIEVLPSTVGQNIDSLGSSAVAFSQLFQGHLKI